MHRLVTWEAISEPISLDSWQMKQLWPNKGEQSDCFLCCLFAVGQSVRLKKSQNGILGEENRVDISYCIYCEAILKGLAVQSKAKKYKIHWLNLGAIQHRVTLTYVYTSVTNSSDGLIFVKRRAKDGRFFSKNTGVRRAKRRAKFKLCIKKARKFDLRHFNNKSA